MMDDVQASVTGFARSGELSLQERDARWRRVRNAMAEADLAVLVTPPNPGFWDQLQANGTYLSSVGGNNAPVSVVFPLEGEVTAVVGPVPSAGFWLAWQSWVKDVRATHWAVTDGTVKRLREMDLRGKRIGVAGLKGLPRFPDGIVGAGFKEALETAFPDAELVDATELLDVVRSSKTAEERAAVVDAVLMAEEAFQLLCDEAKAGEAERIIYGKMVGRLIELGSLPPNFLMWAVGTPFGFSLAPFPTSRKLMAGVPIYCEIEARSSSGYLGQITRTAIIGEPSDNLKDMFEVCSATFATVMETMKPGATMGDVLGAYKKPSDQGRYRTVPVIHARALGEDRPMIIFDTSDPQILAFELSEDQVYAVKVQVRDERSGEMAFWGESISIGLTGAVRSGQQPVDLAIIG
jgi:Xaa-Pro aminopeptidase